MEGSWDAPSPLVGWNKHKRCTSQFEFAPIACLRLKGTLDTTLQQCHPVNIEHSSEQLIAAIFAGLPNLNIYDGTGLASPSLRPPCCKAYLLHKDHPEVKAHVNLHNYSSLMYLDRIGGCGMVQHGVQLPTSGLHVQPPVSEAEHY